DYYCQSAESSGDHYIF
nr:immunoglobulin light chain junction region [Macaca mulatta]